MSVLHRFVYIVISAFVLGSLFGITGIWAAFPVSELLLACTIVAMASKHERRFPTAVSDMLFLPAGFGGKRLARFYREIRTKDEAVEASAAAGKICREHGMDERSSYYASLCIEELAVNNVVHGFYKKRQSAAIYLSVSEEDGLTIRFRDNGKHFDLTKWCEMFDKEDKLSHIGIKMVVSLAEDITYTNSLNTNNILIKL